MDSEFTVRFDMTNGAFIDYPNQEVGDILDKIKYQFMSGKQSGVIQDSNGNTIGTWGVTSE